MKLLLVYTNTNRYLTPPPVGIAYMVQPLLDKGHDVKLLDFMLSNDPVGDLEKMLSEFRPDIAGFSVRNLDNQFMLDLKAPLPEIKQYVAQAKNRNIITILGGTAFTTFPMEMLRYMEADYGIAGQGEEALPLLMDALEQKTGFGSVPGLVYRDNEILKRNPPLIAGYAQGKPADWSLIDIARYKKIAILTPPGAVVVKTGCPYNCSFCDAKASMGDRFIFREIDAIIAELKRLKRDHRIRNFFFIDSCFNSPLDFSKKLLERIIREELKIRFVCHLEPASDAYDGEFFSLMKKAGVRSTMSDCASFSDRMLASYQKPFRTDDLLRFFRLADRYGLRYGASILIGGPGETHETIAESMALLPKIHYSFFSYAIGIRISPHAPIYETALKEGLVTGPGELLFSKFYISKAVDVAWAKKTIDRTVKKYAYRSLKMLPLVIGNVLEKFKWN